MNSPLQNSIPDPYFARLLPFLEAIASDESLALAEDLRARHNNEAALQGILAGADGSEEEVTLDHLRAWHMVARYIAAVYMDDDGAVGQPDQFVRLCLAYDTGFRVGDGSLSLAP